VTLDQGSYRKRIYEKYASKFHDAGQNFDPVAAVRLGKGYDYYFRNWLSASRDASILDLACGGGNLLYYFKERGYACLTGVDISSEQVQLARQVTPNVFEGNVLDFLRIHPNAFDCLLGVDIIEHLYKTEVLNFLDLCFSALRPGGRLILQTPNADSPWGTMLRYGDFTHEVIFNSKSLLYLLALSGFKESEARELGPVPWGYSMASTGRYVAWQFIRVMLKLWNLAETGKSGSGIFSRVFLVSGCKRRDANVMSP
jgi:2-polyprenyl-3-methyl-5-hydroxy-6-metoxy-1,4-benzoquinol methylase